MTDIGFEAVCRCGWEGKYDKLETAMAFSDEGEVEIKRCPICDNIAITIYDKEGRKIW